jgi:predicted ATPase
MVEASSQPSTSCPTSRTSSSKDGVSAISDVSGEFRRNDISKEFTSSICRPNNLRRSTAESDNLAVNKLRFSSLGLYGRENEMATLNKCLESVMSKDDRRQLVLISGYSGTGKTALASTLKMRVKRLKGAFISGKFDLCLRDEPYTGITAACRELCGEMLLLRDTPSFEALFQEIRRKIVDQLGAELRLLTHVIPHLHEIVGESEGLEDKMERQGHVEAKSRFNYAFRRFFRVMSSYFMPLVMFLDDLQWADLESLDLLGVLIADRDNPNLMVIGCYRSNEVNETHILTKILRDLQDKNEQDGFDVTEITVGSLEIPDTHRMLMDLISEDDSRTLSLAQICHKKTDGNAFFFIHFLSSLHQQHLLSFNLGTLKWSWDESEIESQMLATENVVDLMKYKMDELPDPVIQSLQLAACLGSTFDEKTLGLVWDEIRRGKDDTKEDIEHSLHVAVEEGLLEEVGSASGSYRWVHDKIQEAAFSLVAENELARLRSQVGDILVSQLGERELDGAIFVVVNLLNEGSVVSEGAKRVKLAELNLQAARKATEFSAFESAAKYTAKGIEMLPSNHWQDKFELALELYSTAAEAEGYIGDVEQIEAHCSEVLDQTRCSLSEKLRVYNVLMDSIANRDRMSEAVDLCLGVLKQSGCKFPNKSIPIALSTVVGVVRIKVTVKSRTSEESSKMQFMTDARRIENMKLLDKLTTYCYLADNALLPLVVFRSLKWTIRYGLCDYAPPAFATTGGILTGVLFDLQGGSTYGKHALLLMERLGCKTTESRTLFVVYSFVLPWTRPAQSMLRPLLRSYEIGLQTGDTESAMWAIYHYILIAFQAGRSLVALEADCRVYLKQMQEFKRYKISSMCRLTWQMMLNLIGPSENTTVSTGEAMDQEECLEGAARSMNHHLLAMLQVHQHALYAIFGEHELGADLAISKGGDLAKQMPGCKYDASLSSDLLDSVLHHGRESNQNVFLIVGPAVWMDMFLKGISLFAMARKTRERKYTNLAKKSLASIKDWEEKGNPNVRHCESLLEAELAALNGRKHVAKKHYEVAAKWAGRGGFVRDAALVNERYGEFLLEDMSDQEEAAFRFQEAIKLYLEWEARAKAKLLFAKYGYLWSSLPPKKMYGL